MSGERRQPAWVDQLGRWIRPAAPSPGKKPPAARTGRLALGLQGGGALGAFTWGVLDRLLEDQRLPLTAIGGTSAGAVNGAVLVSGWMRAGPTGARAALDRLWRRLSETGRPAWMPGVGQAAGAVALDVTSRLFSPYQLNPLDLNPLRDLLDEEVDFQALADPAAPELVIAATRIRDGEARLFRRGQITRDAILASACLPSLHQAVEIDGEGYWDGGYSANPPLKPLVADERDRPTDLLVVQLNPLAYGALPTSSREIMQRLNQIVFNRSLLEDWPGLEAAAAAGRFRLHRLAIDFDGLPPGGALDLDWAFLEALKDQGRAKASAWIETRPLTQT